MHIHTKRLRSTLLATAALVAATACNPGQASSKVTVIPDPKVDAAASATSKPRAVAVFAGGCFWGVEAVFEHLKGVGRVTSGYVGGRTPPPVEYDDVSRGTTGYAEAVRVEYDPSKISYGQLLKVFFSVAHDPTQLNRQGPDTGTQYRSGIFYGNADQQKVAQAYITQLDAAKVYRSRIVTEVTPLKTFFQAEDYHQDYLRRHPNQPYIVIHDAPKLVNLKKQFPQLYKSG